MAVKINLELKAGDVASEILGIAGALETLEAAADGVDLDFDDLDVDEITGEIGNMVEKLEGLDLDLSELDNKLTRLETIADEGIEIEADINKPSGSTNEGDSTGADPPDADVSGDSGSGGLNEKALARKIENVGGFDKGSVDVLGDFDSEELNRIASNIEHTTQDLTSGEYPHVSGIGDGNLGSNQVPGNFADSEDPSEMSWNKLQRRASEAGVYTQNADRDLLESRLKSQQFGGKAITVDTESHGTVGLTQARRIKQGAYDFPETPDEESLDFDRQEALQFDRDRSKIPDTDLREAVPPEAIDPIEYDRGDALEATRGRSKIPDVDLREAVPSQQLDLEDYITGDGSNGVLGNFIRRINDIDSKGGFFDALGDGSDAFSKKLRRLKPTMGKYMQLLAALIPIAVALGTQLLGVAAAMGSVAAAGGAIMGLGLLGHGESMAGSMAEAKQQMRSLKQEMFQMAQPTMQQFAPIQSRMFDAIPEGLEGVFKEMEGLTDFEDTLFELGGALAGGMEEAIEIINENEQAISQLATRFGGLIGSGLLNFFEFLIQSASKNQQLIIDLGNSLVSLAVVAYNVSMAIARIISSLEPLFILLGHLSGLLNNKLVVGFLTVITVMVTMMTIFTKVTLFVWNFYVAIQAVLGLLAILGGGSILAGISAMFGTLMIYIEAAIAHFSALELAALSAAAAIAATGIGALVVGAGMAAAGAMGTMGGAPDDPGGYTGSGAGGMGGGGKTVYNDNRSYEINNGGGDDYASQKSMEDTVKRVNETSDAQSLPDVNVSSEDSDGK